MGVPVSCRSSGAERTAAPGSAGNRDPARRARIGHSSAAEELLDPLDVSRGDRDRAGLTASLSARLDLEPVPQARLLAAQLAGAGDLDALRGPAVGLVLGHD